MISVEAGSQTKLAGWTMLIADVNQVHFGESDCHENPENCACPFRRLFASLAFILIGQIGANGIFLSGFFSGDFDPPDSVISLFLRIFSHCTTACTNNYSLNLVSKVETSEISPCSQGIRRFRSVSSERSLSISWFFFRSSSSPRMEKTAILYLFTNPWASPEFRNFQSLLGAS
jgi:hypothetical protein